MTRATVGTVAVVALIGLGAAAVPMLVSWSTRSAHEQVIRVTAKKFEYNPNEITVKKDVPVVLEITSLDRDHGFKLGAFGVRADIKPGKVTRVRIVPNKTGRFPFECDVFCGSGHEGMTGELVVVD
jgi:cytochrome c oxidase subunit 2